VSTILEKRPNAIEELLSAAANHCRIVSLKNLHCPTPPLIGVPDFVASSAKHPSA
jgi:hypothetical protein